MTRILSGTAAVLAGSRTVAFTGAPLSDANCPVDGTVVLGGASYFIASRTDTSHFELTRDYEGVDGTVSCEIDPLNANAINLVRVARSITEYNAKLALTDAYGKGLFYECIGLTGANDPAPGKLARNAAAWADTTEIYMDVLDYGGHEQGALIDLAKAGTVYIVRGIDTGAYAAYTLSAAPQNMGPDAWRKISLSYVDGDGLIADGELVAVEWNRKGESFAADAEVDDMAGRAAYDNEAPGFVVKVNDDGAGRAVFFTMGTGGAGAWGSPAYLTGTKGDKGDQGNQGWAPQLVGVNDGNRRVFKLAGYVGGAGVPPTENIGDFLKGDGTFTANIAEALDFRGAPGLNGTGTVASVEAGDGIEVDATDPTAPIVKSKAFVGDSGAGGVIGAVPSPAAGDAAANKFLGADGSWRKPAGGGKGLFNYIINGDFDHWQRGTGQTADGIRSDDRWWNRMAGGTLSHSRQAFTPGQADVPGGPTYYSRTVVVHAAGAANVHNKQQRVEGVRTLAGKQATITIWGKADAARPIAVEIIQRFGTGGSPSADVTTFVGKPTLGTSWGKYSLLVDVPSILGKTLGSNGDDSLDLIIWFEAGSNYNARTGNLGQQSGTFDIAHVSLVAGDATAEDDPFPPRDVTVELDMCRRFYQKSYRPKTNPGTATYEGSIGTRQAGANFIWCFAFTIQMRGVPTMVFYNPVSGATGTWRDVNGSADISVGTVGIGLSPPTEVMVGILVSSSAGNLINGHFTADAEL